MAHAWTIDITPNNKVLGCWKPIPLVPILINSNIQTDDAKPLSFLAYAEAVLLRLLFYRYSFGAISFIRKRKSWAITHFINEKCLYPWRQTGKKIVTAQLNTFSSIVATSFLRMFADFTFSPYPSFYISFFSLNISYLVCLQISLLIFDVF